MNAVPGNQAVFESVLSGIFPGANVVVNARKEVALKSPLNGKYLEADVWYPDLKLVFEYQDEYHYHPTWYNQNPLSLITLRDNLKRMALLERGDTLIRIPCWWDGTQHSVQATIHFHRPEMFRYRDTMIPLNPPENFFPAAIVPKNMQLMLTSFPRPPEVFVLSDTSPWWMGEKYDGVRCHWNPNTNTLYSRVGHVIEVPSTVSNFFGRVVFDAELWCGRGLFLETQRLVNAVNEKIDWVLRVISFDEASHEMSARPFESRYSLLCSHYSPENPTVIISARVLCKTMDMLHQSLQTVVEGGGEGVIIRKPLSLYERGRTSSLLKFKASKIDQEALVVDVYYDGSLLLQLPDGSNFVVDKSDCVLHRRAVRGDIVTYTHDFATRQPIKGIVAADAGDAQDRAPNKEGLIGAPSNPTVFRIRDDISWEDVLQSTSLSVRHFLNEPGQKLETTYPPRGYWGYDKGKTMRAHLESIGRSHGFDPLIAENWYNVSRQELMQHKDIRTMLLHYDGSLIQALRDLFPELNLEVSKFATTPKSFWITAKNRREVYEQFAHERGADPLNPNFWYKVSTTGGLTFKKAFSIIPYHKYSPQQALLDLFPEVSFDPKKFYQSPLHKLENRRKFLEKYAYENGFDPHNALNWDSHRTLRLLKHKGTFAVLAYHNNSVAQALGDVFPNLQWSATKFAQKA